MGRYRKVAVAIWGDQDFMALTDDAQLFFFMLLTHPHMTSVGAMRGNLPGLAAEKGWSRQRVSKAFRNCSEKNMVKVDDQASCIWLPNFLDHNGPENPNVVIGWGKALDLIPECPMKLDIYLTLENAIETLGERFRKAFERVSKPFKTPEQEQEQEQEPERACARGVPRNSQQQRVQRVFDLYEATPGSVKPDGGRVVSWLASWGNDIDGLMSVLHEAAELGYLQMHVNYVTQVLASALRNGKKICRPGGKERAGMPPGLDDDRLREAEELDTMLDENAFELEYDEVAHG